MLTQCVREASDRFLWTKLSRAQMRSQYLCGESEIVRV
jgi:hypothetical protein